MFFKAALEKEEQHCLEATTKFLKQSCPRGPNKKDIKTSNVCVQRDAQRSNK